VSDEPVILQTILGSCVSVCLWDEKTKVGGMNHFMVPHLADDDERLAYGGAESITRLVTAILRIGGEISRMKVKLFGGGRVIKGFSQNPDVGRENIAVAKKLLGEYGIPIVKEFSGHDYGIKVIFYTATGRAFLKKLDYPCHRSHLEEKTALASFTLQNKWPFVD